MKPPLAQADVLIITALPVEMEALRNVSLGALGATWETLRDKAGYEYYLRDFRGTSGGSLRIAAARAVTAGAGPTSLAASRLVWELRPACLAMCGICAGRRGEIFLGDVIVADRVFRYDAGKLLAFRNAEGQRVEDFLHDIESYQLDPRWRASFDDFAKGWTPGWTEPRPLSLVYQERWLLDTLYRSETEGTLGPLDHPDRQRHCPDWKRTLQRAERNRFLLQGEQLALSQRGRLVVVRLRREHPDGLPSDPSFKVRLGPIGTGEKVVVDPEVFEALEKVNRKILGLEMEAQAIGLVAEIERVEYMIVAKGVQDFADLDKDDSFRVYAARASAEFLIAFLRRHMPSRTPSSRLLVGAPAGPQPRPPTPRPDGRFHPELYVPRPEEEREVLDLLESARPAVIWGPKRFGKTWLMKAVVRSFMVQNPDARLVSLSADHVEPHAQRGLDEFLRWLAQILVGETVNPARIDDAWRQSLAGPKEKLSRLLQEHVLAASPGLLLALDRADDLLRYGFAEDFFKLLRSWKEDDREPWPRLRLLMAVSTRPSRLIQLLNNSPFNLSQPIDLHDFDDSQLATLAGLYGLYPDPVDLVSLRELVGGHPFLASLAFEQLAMRPSQTLRGILTNGEGLFNGYLEELRRELRQRPDLLAALIQLRRQPATRLDLEAGHELERAGLIELEKGRGRLRCKLYELLVSEGG